MRVHHQPTVILDDVKLERNLESSDEDTSEGVDSDEGEVQFLQAIEMREPVDEGVRLGRIIAENTESSDNELRD